MKAIEEINKRLDLIEKELKEIFLFNQAVVKTLRKIQSICAETEPKMKLKK